MELSRIAPAAQSTLSSVVDPRSKQILTDRVREAWQRQCASLEGDARTQFEQNACNGLASYLEALETACRTNRDKSFGFKILDWLDPIFKAVQLVTPAATIAIGAYPTPGSLVLGGIVGVVQALQRVPEYQKLVVQLLAKMGRKAQVLFEYETVVYEEETRVQLMLVQVYGDILAFCQAAFRILPSHDSLKVKIIGLRLSVLRDFESRLGDLVQRYEQDVEVLEQTLCLCDRERLQRLCSLLEIARHEFGKSMAEQNDLLRQQGDSRALMEERDQELAKLRGREAEEEEQRRRIQWLSQISFRTIYDEKCDDHLEGTGTWLTDSGLYREWRDKHQSNLLWMKGKPGCGKSVLAAVTIADLTHSVSPDVAVAYAFCQRSRNTTQDATRILGALVGQVCRQQTNNEVLRVEYLEHLKDEPPSARTIRRILQAALPTFREVFIVVDALDECRDNETLIQELVAMVRAGADTVVKVAVFSRLDFNIEEAFQAYPTIQPDSGANTKDLKAYIDSLFPDDRSNVNEEIRAQVVAKADGMFQWVKLLHQTMKKPLNKKQKLQKVKEIPAGLESIYDRIMDDIWAQDPEIRATAVLVLLWTTHAKRALSATEMLDAVADFEDATKLSEVCRYESAGDLVAICANLVFIDKDDHFQLCHESVRGYLDTAEAQSPSLTMYQHEKQHVQRRLAEVCLRYLLLEDFNRGSAESQAQVIIWSKKYPFLTYAARFWGAHAREADDISSEMLLRVIRSANRRDLSLQLSFRAAKHMSDQPIDQWSGSRPMHVVALFGLTRFASQFADTATMLQTDSAGRTPLHYALLGGQREMSAWLLDRYPISKLPNLEVIRLVHFAAKLGWTDLLDAVVSADSQYTHAKLRYDGATPIIEACGAGQVAAAELLIRKGAKVNQQDGKGRWPLIVTVHSGNQTLLRLLLDHGAEPNCCDEKGTTPLHFAALAGAEDIVNTLLEKYADPAKATYDEKFTPMHYAAEQDAPGIINALFHAKASLDMVTKDTFTPLTLAVRRSALRAVKALLKLGAPHDCTALHWAAYHKNLPLVQLMVDEGWDLTLTDSVGDTAIYFACSQGPLPILSYMLEPLAAAKQTELINTKDLLGRVALHVSIEQCHPDIARYLIDHGADIEINNTQGSNPLHLCIEYARLDIAQYLIDHGANLAAANAQGANPLHLSIEYARFDLAQYMIEKGADINAVNGKGSTPLHMSLYYSRLDLAQHLLDLGADPASIGENNSTPLHLAALANATSLLRSLLLSTRNPNPRDAWQDTPLHNTAIRGNIDSARLLLEVCTELDLAIDISTKNVHHLSPLHKAAQLGCEEVATLLIERGASSFPDEDGNYPIHYAAAKGTDAIVKLLLEKEGSGAKGAAQRTPFHLAVFESHLSTAKLLASHADPEEIDAKGLTPLMTSMINEDTETALYILDLGINMTANSVKHCWPLHGATIIGDLVLVQRLLAAGCAADAPCPSARGLTPLHCAAMNGRLDILDAMIAAGYSDFTAADMRGLRCRDYAANEGSLAVLKRIDALGTVNDLKGLFGWSPAHHAASNGHLDVLKYLHEKGDDLSESDSSGLTTLTIAASQGYWKVVEYLVSVLPSHVNEHGQLVNVSALHTAASLGYLKTTRILLAAGADVFSKDMFGRDAMDYATIRTPILRLMHEAHHFHRSEDTSLREKTCRSTVPKCCRELLGGQLSVSSRYILLQSLAMLLMYIKDDTPTAICLQGMHSMGKELGPLLECRGCGKEEFEGDRYYCRSCDSGIVLCSGCYREYTAKKALPEAMQELFALERKVDVVRDAVPDGLEIAVVSGALRCVESSWTWVLDLLQEYESWATNWNDNGNYNSLSRHGLDFLQMIRKFQDEIGSEPSKGSATEQASVGPTALEKEFATHVRKYPPGREYEEITCQGHEFLKVTPTEKESDENWAEYKIFQISWVKPSTITPGTETSAKNIEILPIFFQDLLSRYEGSEEKLAVDGPTQLHNPMLAASLENAKRNDSPTGSSKRLSEASSVLFPSYLASGKHVDLSSSAQSTEIISKGSKEILQPVRRARTLPVAPSKGDPPRRRSRIAFSSRDNEGESHKKGPDEKPIPEHTVGKLPSRANTDMSLGDAEVSVRRPDASALDPSQALLASIRSLKEGMEEAKRKSAEAARRRTEVYGSPDGKNQVKWYAALFADLINPGMQELLLLEEEQKSPTTGEFQLP